MRQDQASFALPAYRADLVEIRLRDAAAAASRVARDARTAQGVEARIDRLGVPDVDALLGAWGGAWLEPEFRGETPPAPGSGETDFTAFYLAHLPDGVSLSSALDRLTSLPSVASADPIAILPVSAIPNDSLWSASTWYYRLPGRTDVHAPEAWDLTTGDSSIVIAILDTGVIPYHPDLGGRVAGWSGLIWTNPVEAAGVPGVDDDGNGFVDDVHGWDFVHALIGGIPPQEDSRFEDNDPNDYAGHGTAVAGLAAALSDNAIGVSGMNWGARIMPLRVAYAQGSFPLGLVEMPFVARALRYATLMGANVINCSFATDGTASVDAAADAAVRAGALIVCAAGNDGQPQVMGERADVVAVASCDADDRILTDFPSSNLGPNVDLAAPGKEIISTFIVHNSGTDSIGARTPAYTVVPLSGTSLSSPLVAGAAALVQAWRRYWGFPLLDPLDLMLRLYETTDDISAANPGLTGYGSGRLNAYRAIVAPLGSTAFRLGQRSVGAPVVLNLPTGAKRTVYATDGEVVFVDGRETIVARTATVAPPIGDPAAGDLGDGLGPAVFVAVTGGRIDAFDASGARRAGWPVAATGLLPDIATSPALGDLDGDGTLEVVAVVEDGEVWAWRANGTPVPGFPVAVGLATGGPALADLDGDGRAEILLAGSSRTVYAIGGDGVSVTGWPVSTGADVPVAPVVTRFAPGEPPTVIVAAGSSLRAYGPAGILKFNVPLPGQATQDPALCNLDGSGPREIIVATHGADAIAVFDSTGAALTARGWPCALPFEPMGPPLLGQLRRGDFGISPEVLVYDGVGLAVFSDSAVAIPFRKPGNAGRRATLEALDGTSTQILAGTGPDTLNIAYVYDTGPGSRTGLASSWPTPRGSAARNGSTLDPPRSIRDMRITAATDTTLALTWTTPGDDGPNGRPERFFVHVSADASFANDTIYDVLCSVPGGAEQTLEVGPLMPATRYWFKAVAVDEDGNVSVPSTVVSSTTGVGGPLAGEKGMALAALARPSHLPVRLYWQSPAPGARQEIVVFDLSGRRVRALPLAADPGGVTTWDGRDDHGESVPAGLYFARLSNGSLHAQTRIVLLP